METALAPKTHNLPPIEAPSAADALDDVRARHAGVELRRDELLSAAKNVPNKITDEDTAKDTQTLLKEMSETLAVWTMHRKTEKGPWQRVADTVYAFFSTPIDQVKKAHDDVKLRYTAYQELVREKERLAREETAKRQREDAERIRKEAEEAQARKEAAEQAEREAREREERARKEADAAERARKEADERAAAAREEEKRLTKEKEERERAEKKVLATDLAQLARLMVKLERLCFDDAEGTLPTVRLPELDELLSPTGEMQMIGSRLAQGVSLLDEIQLVRFKEIRDRRRVLQTERTARVDEKLAAERRRLEEEAAAKEAERARIRREEREAEEKRLDELRLEREAQEKRAAEEKAKEKEAKKDIRSAVTAQASAKVDAKEAGRDEKLATAQADKTEARADRMQRRADNASDADLTRLRDEHGSVGSLSGRWQYAVLDYEKVDLEKLREYLLPAHIDAAVYRFMRHEMGAWNKEQRQSEALQGVEFDYVPEARIA